MVMSKNRSDQKKRIRSQIYQKEHTENTRNSWKPKTGKNHGVARKSTIVEKLQGDEEEDLIGALYNSFRF